MWNKEKIMRAVDSFVQETGRFPSIKDFYEREELPSIKAIRREWGTPAKFQKEMYDEYSRKSIPGMIEIEINPQNIQSFIRENGRLPYISEICGKELSMDIADKYVDAITEVFVNDNVPSQTINLKERERIIGLIDTFVEQHNRLPKSIEFKPENGLVSYRMTVKHIGKMTDFYKTKYPQLYAQSIQETVEKREDSKRSNTFKGTLTEENVKTAIDNFVKEHGRLPERNEFNAENGLPGLSTCYHIIGALGKYYFRTYPELVLKSKVSIEDTMTEGIEEQEEIVDEGMTMGM